LIEIENLQISDLNALLHVGLPTVI
jgi:hypothetical protein